MLTGWCHSCVYRQIKDLSWLPQALEHEERSCVSSEYFQVTKNDLDSTYCLAFSPHGGRLHGDASDDDFSTKRKGTLALVRRDSAYGATVETSFFVKDSSGRFVQWGDTSRKVVPSCDPAKGAFFGPDVGAPTGLFGLGFDELLRSVYVADDMLEVKVVVKDIQCESTEAAHVNVLRHDEFKRRIQLPDRVKLPPPTLASDLLALLKSGTNADLTIVVKSESAESATFLCHAAILSMRSEGARRTAGPMPTHSTYTHAAADWTDPLGLFFDRSHRPHYYRARSLPHRAGERHERELHPHNRGERRAPARDQGAAPLHVLG